MEKNNGGEKVIEKTMVSIGYNGVKGMEQLIYNTQRLSFGDVPEAHLCRRDRLGFAGVPEAHLFGDNSGADEIMHKLANTQLEENLSDSSSSNISGATMIADANRYFCITPLDLDWVFDPAVWRKLACAALEEYQNTQGVQLELNGKVSASSSFFPYRCCFHLNFEANDSAGTTKKMFAEVFQYDNGDCKVNFCGIVDPITAVVTKGCRICPRKILHPKGLKLFNMTKS